MATCNPSYRGFSGNRVPHCVHWGRNDLISFGTCNSVALTTYSDDGMQPVSAVLNGHKDRVNCVKWIESHQPGRGGPGACSSCQELVSGSSDNSLIVWSGNQEEFALSDHLMGHSGPVTAVDGIYLTSISESGQSRRPRTLIVSASTDSSVKVWERSAEEEDGEDRGTSDGGVVRNRKNFVEKQSISFGSGFAIDVALTLLGEAGSCVPLLALGGDDCRVHLYVETDGVFTKALGLAGHEDWVRGLEFTHDDSGDVLLASCSQDCFIRVWKVSSNSRQAGHQTDRQTSQGEGPSSWPREIQLKKNTFTVQQKDIQTQYDVNLESVLSSHEQWIYAVHWQRPVQTETGKPHQPLCLLSASMDKTMIVWRMDEASGMWLDEVRVGEVGGNTLGLYGCQFSPDGQAILAHGYQGAFQLWRRAAPRGAAEEKQEEKSWEPAVVVSGHFAGVQDMVWHPSGHFLLTVGLDQTTRLHALWKRDGKETWHEIARPQIHGYNMQCLAMVGPYAFVSGAEEKVLRVFEAPLNFLDNLMRISGVDTTAAKAVQEDKNLPEGASVPALGLSNKAIYQDEGAIPESEREINHPSELYPEVYFAPATLQKPPTEDYLLQNTLWPETQKLYGHGNEVFSVASHPSGKVIASACKASQAEHAVVILWDTSSWEAIGQLRAHSLTVTQLAFSHQGRWLLAVSRDRTWSLYERSEKEGMPYQLIARTDKKTSVHSRIIWACTWSHDDRFFATASRDKKVIIWGKKEDAKADSAEVSPLGQYGAISTPLDVGDSASAVDFAQQSIKNGSYILAVGVESGKIFVHSWNPLQPSSWECLFSFPKHLSHTSTVKRLRWRPSPDKREEGDQSGQNRFQLASCSSDGSVRIHTFQGLFVT